MFSDSRTFQNRRLATRKDAVESLGEIGTPVAVQAITKALNDRDPQVRKAAAEALGEIKDD